MEIGRRIGNHGCSLLVLYAEKSELINDSEQEEQLS